MASLHAYSLTQIENTPLPGPSAVVCMADSAALLARIRDASHVVARLDLVFNDAGDDFSVVRAPTDEDARRIVDFVREHERTVPHIVFQCQVGVGRSIAAYAAMLQARGEDPRPALYKGTHNRKLHAKLLAAAGLPPRAEPRVSLVVRLKYAPDRMEAFVLCMRRQRYDNWEVVFVTDGPNAQARERLERLEEPRAKLIETPKALGRWGHPYRQAGIEAASGELIGLSNDDNYYVPGYLEQMVNALEQSDADLVFCAMLHSYWGWQHVPPGHDVGSWIARRALIERTPWQGEDFFYDSRYIALLRDNAGSRVTALDRPLLIHN